MTLNFNIKQKRYIYSNLQIVSNNVELVSTGEKKSRFFDFWPHDFDFAPLCVVRTKMIGYNLVIGIVECQMWQK